MLAVLTQMPLGLGEYIFGAGAADCTYDPAMRYSDVQEMYLDLRL
jgi:hypothetical protein